MSCKISAIVAVCDDWGIGHNGGMVVANSRDMRHFVHATTGHAVIMGRRTLESFPGGRPLKNRRNIVLTRDPFFHRQGVEVAHDVAHALELVADEDEAWVIGGAQIYRQFLPYCQEAEVTKTIASASRTRISPIWTRIPHGSLPTNPISPPFRAARAMKGSASALQPISAASRGRSSLAGV